MTDNVKVLLRYKENIIDALSKHMNDDLDNQNCAVLANNLLHAYKCDVTSLAMEGYEEDSSGYHNGRRMMPKPYNVRGYDNGYSKGADEEYIRMLKELKSMAPDDHAAQEIQRMIDEAYHTR